MGSKNFFTNNEDLKQEMSVARATITTPFLANNVVEVENVSDAYELALNSPGTIELTGMPVFQPEKLGLPKEANQLLFNDGAVVGRCIAARKIVGEPDCDLSKLLPIIRDAIYNTRYKTMYKADAIVGLDKDFTIKAHLLVPQGFENTLYSWMLNFQAFDKETERFYNNSNKLDESDIYVFSDPDWAHPDFPYGLTFFDAEHNCAALLGMRYFGEHKKGTLTLAWGAASRQGYVSCHGGMKRYNNIDGKSFQMAVFGLSGSGKSTLTHAKHKGKYDITVLHDDAFIINTKEKFTIALEPSYFDKTIDYPIGSEANKYILTHQNEGAIQLTNGDIVTVPEDIRNGNGRAVKSKFWSPNRVNRINEPLNAIFWLMKDPTIPPVIKLEGAALGAAMGATLATKRTAAERLAEGVDPNAIVVEPYANPFRVHPLAVDYERFKQLIEDGVDCYILNTGEFMGEDIPSSVTLGIIESIVEKTAKFHNWECFDFIKIMDIAGYTLSFKDKNYLTQFMRRMNDRIEFIKSREQAIGGRDRLPIDALEALETIVIHLHNITIVKD